ncbi:MAG: hypothetical protein LUE14_12350 [Clostridiales bacterium]|nr:hypothetical protein [Clostridiales bacterium]
MGHEVEYRSYPENIDRKKVQADWDHYASMEDWQEGCCGLYHDIRWLENAGIQKNRDAAEEYLKKADRGGYDQLAVRYYDTDYRKIASNRLTELRARAKTLREKYFEMDKKFHFKDAKSQFVGCKKCGSKLSIKYLGGPFARNTCPLCQTDLRPQSTLDRISRTHDAWQKCLKDIEAEEEKLAKKARKDVCWLVKIEYHS